MTRRKISQRHPVVALLFAGIGSLLAAGPAGAYLKDFQFARVNSAASSLAAKEVPFKCFGGRKAIGVGASVPAISNLGLSSMFTDLSPFVSAHETDSDGVVWALTHRAWCALETDVKPSQGGAATYIKGIEVVRRRGPSSSSAFKSVEVACPASSPNAIGGGGAVAGPTSDVTLESVQRLRQGTVLRVKAHETDATGVRWALEAHAICANTTTAISTNVYADEVSVASADDTSSATKTLTASCPSGKVAVGGGAYTSSGVGDAPARDVVLEQSRPAGAGPSATGWKGTGVEVDPTAASWELSVRAICANPNGAF